MKQIIMPFKYSFYAFLMTLFSSFSKSFAQQALTLPDIFQASMWRAKTAANWQVMQGNYYACLETDSLTGITALIKKSYTQKTPDIVLVQSTDLVFSSKQIPLKGYQFSPDESKLLLAYDVQSIYRRSTSAQHYIYDLTEKKLSLLSENVTQQSPVFSPDGQKIAFVRENNLYIYHLENHQEQQITHDGLPNKIINGLADWVYEEEFGFSTAFHWSKDSQQIAYLKFDESNVSEFPLILYQGIYPEIKRYKYPKAGDQNACVSVHIYDLPTQNTQKIQTDLEKSSQKSSQDYYIPRILWAENTNQLLIYRLNRHQNRLDVLQASIQDAKASLFLQVIDSAYVDVERSEKIYFLPKDKLGRFILTSERAGYNQIYLYDRQGEPIRQITKNSSEEITEIYGIDADWQIYYQSTAQNGLSRRVYKISLNGKNKQILSQLEGNNSARFSKDYQYFLLEHSNIHQPPCISLHTNAGNQIRVLEDNIGLQVKSKAYGLSTPEFCSLPSADPKQMLQAYFIKPHGFNPNYKYPVLFYVYGGPASQQVKNTWYTSNTLWFSYLANYLNIIIACIDNRGTGYRGANFKKITYLNLGKLELLDQIAGANWLAKQPYIDGKRMGIWGWSYGGYLAANAITQANDVFKMAISVAPVTNWHYYNTIYTERYLRTPQENQIGYKAYSPVFHADGLKGKYLLIHGTADDNVHFQHAISLSEALIQADKQFDQAYYPNKNHGIYGEKTRLQLFNRMTLFIQNNL